MTIGFDAEANVWNGEYVVCTPCLDELRESMRQSTPAISFAGMPCAAWLVNDGANQLGPYDTDQLIDLLRAGEVDRAAKLLGRPAELAGTVVAGDARGGTLGFPTANLRPEPGVLIPGYGIYAGAADGRRAAISIGTNPHYGGDERRIEAFLLDFAGDLYGKRLALELWQRLRDEQAFESEAELVAQIDRDVEATRQAQRP